MYISCLISCSGYTPMLYFSFFIFILVLSYIFMLYAFILYFSYTVILYYSYTSYTFVRSYSIIAHAFILYFSYTVILYYSYTSYTFILYTSYTIHILHIHLYVLISCHIFCTYHFRLGFMFAYTLEADTGNNCMYP